LASLLCLISPSLDSKNSQVLFHTVKPPVWRSSCFPSSLYLGKCYFPAWVCFIGLIQVSQPPYLPAFITLIISLSSYSYSYIVICILITVRIITYFIVITKNTQGFVVF
jgi:hypothetical protein